MRVCPQCERQYGDEVDFCAQDGARLRSVEEESEDPMIGRVLDGRWRIEEKFGEGGMGAIYVAVQQGVGREVAVKTLKSALSDNDEFVDRFMQEARVTTDISHPHCVTIHDFGQTDNGILFLAMELLEGEPLSERMNSTMIGVEEALEIGVQVLSALAAAHDRNIVHRDLKPENVFLLDISDGSTFVKVLDFGISKDLESDENITKTGQLFGTPKYMSPEQCRGEQLDGRSDIYSVGCILYAMLTGRPPFEGDKSMNILVSHVQKDIKPFAEVCDRQIPKSVEDLVMSLLAKESEDRPATATEVRQKIEGLLSQLEGWDEQAATAGGGATEPGNQVGTQATAAVDWQGDGGSGSGQDYAQAETSPATSGTGSGAHQSQPSGSGPQTGPRGSGGRGGPAGSGSQSAPQGSGPQTGPQGGGSGRHASASDAATDPVASSDSGDGLSPTVILTIGLVLSVVLGGGLLFGAYYMYTTVNDGDGSGGDGATVAEQGGDGGTEDESDERKDEPDEEDTPAVATDDKDTGTDAQSDTAVAAEESQNDAGGRDTRIAQVDNDNAGTGGSSNTGRATGQTTGTSTSSGTGGQASSGTGQSAATSSSSSTGEAPTADNGSDGRTGSDGTGGQTGGDDGGGTSGSSGSSDSSGSSGGSTSGSTDGTADPAEPDEPTGPPPSAYVRIKSLSAAGAACIKSDVRRKLNAATSSIGKCFKSTVEKNPGLSGDLMLDWRILTDGSILDASVIKGSLSHGGTRSCVVQAVKQVRFKAPSGGRCKTRVTFGFREP